MGNHENHASDRPDPLGLLKPNLQGIRAQNVEEGVILRQRIWQLNESAKFIGKDMTAAASLRLEGISVEE